VNQIFQHLNIPFEFFKFWVFLYFFHAWKLLHFKLVKFNSKFLNFLVKHVIVLIKIFLTILQFTNMSASSFEIILKVAYFSF